MSVSTAAALEMITMTCTELGFTALQSLVSMLAATEASLYCTKSSLTVSSALCCGFFTACLNGAVTAVMLTLMVPVRTDIFL